MAGFCRMQSEINNFDLLSDLMSFLPSVKKKMKILNVEALIVMKYEHNNCLKEISLFLELFC